MSEAATDSKRNETTIRSIRSLIGEKFYIPNYQRGYRWTKVEVKKLVEDLYGYFHEKEDSEYYCLQPLVVKKRDGGWELIDGQQRITTLFLLLKYLLSEFDVIHGNIKFLRKYTDAIDSVFGNNEDPFQLEYQTRSGSWDFLKYINKNENMDCRYIDYVYIKNAYSVIKDCLDNKDDCLEWFVHLIDEKEKVRFIWYDVTDKCKANENYARELFSRLNIGRIPLTNAELIKSLFLNGIYGQLRQAELINEKDYLDEAKKQYYEAISSQIQYRMASEWDNIEQKLNESDFWAFLYGEDDGRYQTRIELLFDLIKEKPENAEDKFYTFTEYDKSFRDLDNKRSYHNPDNILSCRMWREVMELFYTFCSWFDERDVYHYIGFLRNKKMSLNRIKKLYEDSSDHSAFLENLRKEVLYAINGNREEWSLNDLMGLSYPDDSATIRDILLFFNIENIRKTRSEERFSFGSYYSQSYDLEHIMPQTPKDLSDGEEMKSFIISCLEYLTGCRYPGIAELRQIFYEKELLSYAENNPSNGERIRSLIRKRSGLNPYSESGKKGISDIDSQLRQSVPAIKPRKVNERDVEKYFRDVVERLIEEDSKKQSKEEIHRLVGKLFEKYRALCSGNTPDLDFTAEESRLLGIDNDSGPDTIDNLVLLDTGTNRGYKNASFIVKRRYIQKREENGVYIPRSTRDVFNKMYSRSVAEPMHWSESDMTDYAERIQEALKNG